MSETVREIKEWLNTLNDDDSVGIDDGGLALRVVECPDVYFEIGEITEDEEEG